MAIAEWRCGGARRLSNTRHSEQPRRTSSATCRRETALLVCKKSSASLHGTPGEREREDAVAVADGLFKWSSSLQICHLQHQFFLVPQPRL